MPWTKDILDESGSLNPYIRKMYEINLRSAESLSGPLSLCEKVALQEMTIQAYLENKSVDGHFSKSNMGFEPFAMFVKSHYGYQMGSQSDINLVGGIARASMKKTGEDAVKNYFSQLQAQAHLL